MVKPTCTWVAASMSGQHNLAAATPVHLLSTSNTKSTHTLRHGVDADGVHAVFIPTIVLSLYFYTAMKPMTAISQLTVCMMCVGLFFTTSQNASLAQQQTPTGISANVAAPQNLLSLLRIQRLTDLACGVTILGFPKEIRFSDAAAARFRIIAPPASEILVALALPLRLLCDKAETPLTFGAASAAWSERDSPSLGVTTFNPMLPQRLKVPASGIIFIWIGCSVSPAKTLRSGRYTALVQVEATLMNR